MQNTKPPRCNRAQREFLGAITPQVMRDFNSSFGKKALDEHALSSSEHSMLRKMRRIGDEGYRKILHMTAYDVNRADHFAASMVIGLEYLEKKDWLSSQKVFSLLSANYLNDKRAMIGHEAGEDALNMLRVISRAWVLAHASEYAGMELDAFPMFHGSGIRGDVFWSVPGIANLEKTGKEQDLRMLSVLDALCSKEAVQEACSVAREMIAIREQIASAAARTAAKNGLDGNLSQDQLRYRLTFLIKRFRLGECMETGMQEEEVVKRISQRVRLLPSPSSIHDPKGYKTASEYFEHECIVEKADEEQVGWNPEYKLTEKGKAFVMELIKACRGML